MSSDQWKLYKLGELAEITSSKRIFLSDYTSKGKPFYRSKEIIQKSLGEKLEDILFISDEKFFEIKNKFGIPSNGDLLISAVGERAGIPYVVKNDGDFYFKDGNLIWLKNIDKKLNVSYLYHWIKSKDGKDKIESLMIGSAQKALTIIGLKGFNLFLPNIEVQNEIAFILSTIDDKMENNLSTNQTLEEIVRTLFKEWFVNFNYPNTDGTLKLSEFGGIPESWKVGTLGDIYKTTSGGTPSRSKAEYYENGTIGWIKSKELNNSFIIDTEEKITKDALKNSSAKLLPKYSVLIAIAGATIGELGITTKEFTCNQNACAFISNEEYPFSFIFQFLLQSKNDIISRSVGSAQQYISQGSLLNYKLVIPPSDLVQVYHRIVFPLFQKIQDNIEENENLRDLRDSLLPRLMSGEINVKPANPQ